MINPHKYNYFPLKLFALGGLPVSIFLYFVTASRGPLNFWQWFGLFVIWGLFCLMGFSLTALATKIMHRQVTHPVEPKDLVTDQVYWLNGQTHATYVGQNPFTGQYLFSVYGVDTNPDQPNPTAFLPGWVRIYISDRQEI